MIELKARSGHILRVADEAQASHWEALGYQRAEDEAPAEGGDKKPAPRRRASNRKSASK